MLYYARVVELVYTADLKSAAARIKGSSPFSRTKTSLSATLKGLFLWYLKVGQNNHEAYLRHIMYSK